MRNSNEIGLGQVLINLGVWVGIPAGFWWGVGWCVYNLVRRGVL